MVVRVSRRVLLGEALARAGGTPPTYQTVREAGGFVAMVESSVLRSCHPRCLGLLCAVRSASEAEEA
jgi:hypothetical protein